MTLLFSACAGNTTQGIESGTEAFSRESQEESSQEANVTGKSITISGVTYYYSSDRTWRDLFHFRDDAGIPDDKVLTYREALSLTEGKRLVFSESGYLIKPEESAASEIEELISVYFTLWENGEYWSYCDFVDKEVTEKWALKYSEWTLKEGISPFAGIYHAGKGAAYAPRNALIQFLYYSEQEACVLVDSLMQEHFLHLEKSSGQWVIREDISRSDTYSVNITDEELQTMVSVFAHIRAVLTENAPEGFSEEGAIAALKSYLAENAGSDGGAGQEIAPFDEERALSYLAKYLFVRSDSCLSRPFFLFFVGENSETSREKAYDLSYENGEWTVELLWTE